MNNTGNWDPRRRQYIYTAEEDRPLDTFDVGFRQPSSYQPQPLAIQPNQREIPFKVEAAEARKPREPPASTADSDKNEILDLNALAQRKTALGGALGLGLFSSNTEQLVTLISIQTDWEIKQHIKFWLLIISLFLQLITMVLLAIIGSLGRVTRAKKTRVDRINTTAMVLSLLTTVVNIAVTSFSSQSL